jgi:hypothetical protein
MHKFFGYSAVVIAAGAVSAYVAGSYANNHPDSTMARWMQTAHGAMTEGSPWGPVAEAIGPAFADDGDVTATNCRVSGSAAMYPADPVPVEGAPTGHPPVIKIEEKPSSNRLPGKIVINEEVPPEIRALMKGLQRFEEGQKLGVEECMPTGLIMPYCEDDEPDLAPVMPYAEDAPSETTTHWTFFSSILNFFRKPVAGSTESCEPPAGHAPDCQEDPVYHHQYPGCPYNGPCPKSSNVAPADKSSKHCAPFGEEMQESSPEAKATSDAKKLLKIGTGKKSNIDTTECRPSEIAFGLIGLRPF